MLSACTTETVEVTRIKIMERRVIERIPVTVEVTLSAPIGEPSLDGALPDDARFRLTIAAGLAARSGSVLPVDVIRRFTTGGP